MVSQSVLDAIDEDSQMDHPHLHWYCNSCSVSASKLFNIMNVITVKQGIMQESIDDHDTRIENLESKSQENSVKSEDQKSSIDNMDDHVKKNREDIDRMETLINSCKDSIADLAPLENGATAAPFWPNVQNTQNYPNTKKPEVTTVSEVTRLVNERLDRQNNIMIFNLRESNSQLKDEVEKNDRDLVTELCRFSIGEDLRFSTCLLGARSKRDATDSGVDTPRGGAANHAANASSDRKPRDVSAEQYVPRPVRVTFSDLESKIKIMRKLHQLGNDNVPDELLSISVKHDLTPDEREKEKVLRKQIKEKNTANQEKNSKWVIMGPPWERSMCQLVKRGGHWVPTRNADQNQRIPEREESLPQTEDGLPPVSL